MPESKGKHAADPDAGLVEKGKSYPKSKAERWTREYRVPALPPDSWELQKDTVLAQAAADSGADVDDLEVTNVAADEPNGAVFVTVEADV